MHSVLMRSCRAGVCAVKRRKSLLRPACVGLSGIIFGENRNHINRKFPKFFKKEKKKLQKSVDLVIFS